METFQTILRAGFLFVFIFQRKYFEETQKHLDENMWTWLSTNLNTRLVGAGWHQTRGELRVNAGSQGTQRKDLGARPSVSFFED